MRPLSLVLLRLLLRLSKESRLPRLSVSDSSEDDSSLIELRLRLSADKDEEEQLLASDSKSESEEMPASSLSFLASLMGNCSRFLTPAIMKRGWEWSRAPMEGSLRSLAGVAPS